ncbi:hypothetical protein VTN77DRAFT_1027 [Rasamsonia byssochlamydoides]|uniref:uncharacterized protein n=1 Tax=Rasamsonia byssochlamydoides TaxID=89139 RepID=UPI00374391FA
MGDCIWDRQKSLCQCIYWFLLTLHPIHTRAIQFFLNKRIQTLISLACEDICPGKKDGMEQKSHEMKLG